jgi:uncharacterized protein
MIRSATAATILAMAGLYGGCDAHAASFDCNRARAADERAICADRSLNDQDVRMAVMLNIAEGLVAMGQRGAMQDDQRDWLAARRACGADRRCLAARYQERIAAIQSVLDGVAAGGPY